MTTKVCAGVDLDFATSTTRFEVLGKAKLPLSDIVDMVVELVPAYVGIDTIAVVVADGSAAATDGGPEDAAVGSCGTGGDMVVEREKAYTACHVVCAPRTQVLLAEHGKVQDHDYSSCQAVRP